MPITDYFIAPDDATAAEVADQPGPGLAGLPTAESKGLDPVVCLGTLESFLTGRDYDEVVASPRQGDAVSDTADIPIVVAVTDTLRDALAAVDDARAAEVALLWSQTEELDGTDPADLTEFLHELRDLARQAGGEQHLYCFWSL